MRRIAVLQRRRRPWSAEGPWVCWARSRAGDSPVPTARAAALPPGASTSRRCAPPPRPPCAAPPPRALGMSAPVAPSDTDCEAGLAAPGRRLRPRLALVLGLLAVAALASLARRPWRAARATGSVRGAVALQVMPEGERGDRDTVGEGAVGRAGRGRVRIRAGADCRSVHVVCTLAASSANRWGPHHVRCWPVIGRCPIFRVGGPPQPHLFMSAGSPADHASRE